MSATRVTSHVSSPWNCSSPRPSPPFRPTGEEPDRTVRPARPAGLHPAGEHTQHLAPAGGEKEAGAMPGLRAVSWASPPSGSGPLRARRPPPWGGSPRRVRRDPRRPTRPHRGRNLTESAVLSGQVGDAAGWGLTAAGKRCPMVGVETVGLRLGRARRMPNGGHGAAAPASPAVTAPHGLQSRRLRDGREIGEPNGLDHAERNGSVKCGVARYSVVAVSRPSMRSLECLAASGSASCA